MTFLIAILIFYCSATAATTDDLISNAYSGDFVLPNRIAIKLPGQNVLVVRCGSNSSIRAFANARSMSIAEPTTLENLPASINRSFDLITYQNFNITNDQYESFFKRLSEIIKLNGIILLEFLGDDYRLLNSTFEGVWHGKLESCLRQHFAMESVVDELSHQNFSDEDSSVLINVPSTRFILLQLKGG